MFATVTVKMEKFARLDTAPGIVLMCAAALALLINNSPAAALYEGFLAILIAV
jgi:Na+/H+ antiporter NhaA